MGIKLIALYKRPEDEMAFLRHYHDVHLPLVMRIPHLERTEIDRITGSLVGDPPYFQIVSMCFPDRERFDEAMSSAENRAAGKDLMRFAEGLVTLLIAE